MEWHTGATDFVYKRFATIVNLIEIRWSELRLGGAGKDQISYLQIIDRTVRGRGVCPDLFGDAERGFACFVRRPDVTNDRRVNGGAVDHDGIVAYLRAVRLSEAARNHDEWISCPDEKAEAFERFNLAARLSGSALQLPLPLRGCGR